LKHVFADFTVNEEANKEILLSAATAEAVVERAAFVAAAGMPLAAGLRAAAQESDSWRLARALRSMATELERGRWLDDCLAAGRGRTIRHLAGVIRAARRTGEGGALLAQWFENRRAARQHWRGVLAALAYPALSLALFGLVFLFLAIFVMPVFREILNDFGLRLPFYTTYILRVFTAGTTILGIVVGVGAVALAGVRLIGGRAGWSWLIASLPLIGAAWHWTGVAEMLRCLSLLVEHSVPLPEALRLTSAGIADGYVAVQCSHLAARVEKGMSLTASLLDLRTLPVSIVPLVHWGEKLGELADGLRSAADMIEGRLKMRRTLLVQIIPPVILVFTGAMAISVVVAIFLPLISLIQGLS
jgi:type II secretory pathway component PulF